MTNNKPLFKFLNFKKFIFVIPVILLAIAMLVYGIWGVNKAPEFTDGYSYRINFNTTVSSKDFNTYKNIITKSFNDSGENYRVIIERINDDISSACKVSVYTNNKMDDSVAIEKITKINETIETNLNNQENITKVRVLDVEKQYALTYGSSLLWTGVALIIFMALAFAYLWIRFELKTALSSLIIAPYNFITVLSIMVIFRIPFDFNYMLPVVLATLIGYILFVSIFNEIKNIVEEKDNQLTNDDLVYTSILNNSKNFIYTICVFSLVLVLLIFILKTKALFLSISLLISIIVAMYSSIILATSMWALIYNKANDNKLKARIKILEAREEKKKTPKANPEN